MRREAAIAIVASMVAVSARAATAPNFYFIGGADAGRWCAMSTEAGIRKVETKLHSGEAYVYYDMGSVFLNKNKEISELTISVGPESGDWVMADRYTLKGSKPVSMRRSVGYADGSPELLQTYTLHNGRLTLHSTAGGGYQPVERPYGDMAAAPFYRFLLSAARLTPLPVEGFCAQIPHSRQGGR